MESEKILTEKELLEFLSAVVRGEVQDVQLMTRLVGKGCSIIEQHEYTASVKDRIRAAELLCKINGMFNREEEKTDVSKLFVDTLQAVWKSQPANSAMLI